MIELNLIFGLYSLHEYLYIHIHIENFESRFERFLLGNLILKTFKNGK